MFASFAYRNYKLFWFGSLVSNVGGWISRVAQDWMVLTELTDHSASALGLVTALQFLPTLLLTPLMGSLADRYNKRKLLLLSQVLLAISAFAMWGIYAAGSMTLTVAYALALITGAVQSLDMPVRQAFVSEMVPQRYIPNAIGLNSTQFNGARLIGPAVAGLLISWVGVGPALLINALSFAGVMSGILAMRPDELARAPRSKVRGGVMDGFRYVAGRKDIVMVLVVLFALATFGMNFQVTNALMATERFGKQADGYGLLGSAMAVGTFGAALIAARRARPRLRTLLGALIGFTVFVTMAAFSPNYTTYLVLLVPVGFTSLTVFTCCNAMVQLAAGAQYRGRVMAVYMMVNMGGTPLGAPIVGWVSDRFGAPAGLLIGSVACALATVVVLVFYMTRRGIRFRFSRGWPPRLRIWTSEELIAAQETGSSMR